MTKNTPLADILKERIVKSGPITFREYMKAALYEPGLGYYASGKMRIGRGGDYYTGPSSTPLFGKLLARWLSPRLLEIGGDKYRIIEVGAATGLLASDIKKAISEEFPEVFARLNYWQLDFGDDFAVPETGIIISNELIDAFPVHRVRMGKTGLKELFVDYNGKRFVEVEGEQTTPELQEYLDYLDVELAAGFTAEINLDAVSWIQKAGAGLREGYVLTIDYGYQSPELYAPYRADGTLIGYYKHEYSENQFANIGEQDLTSHVNFSALMKYGSAAGLTVSEYATQSEFLARLGAMKLLEELHGDSVSDVSALKSYLALKDLIMPDGMGGVFKVLAQKKK